MVHGGNIQHFAKVLNRPVESLLDFSASINPLGPPASVVKALSLALPHCQYYPEPYSESLRERIAKEYRVVPEAIAVGNGSVELIRILPQVLGLNSAVIVGPMFSEFEESLRLLDVRWQYLHAVSSKEYIPPIGRLMRKLGQASLADQSGDVGQRHPSSAVFLSNPNSPTGRAVPLPTLQSLCRKVERAGHWLIVDEAFGDFCPEHSLIPFLSSFSRVLVLRSFTKFYGIPGLRLGYVMGPPLVVEKIQRHIPPWSVNHLAQIAGLAALKDIPFRRRSLRWIHQARDRFVEQLQTIPGLRVIPSRANFLLVELPKEYSPGDLVEVLRQEGILIRDCGTFTGILNPAIRLSVQGGKENLRLIRALRSYFSANSKKKSGKNA